MNSRDSPIRDLSFEAKTPRCRKTAVMNDRQKFTNEKGKNNGVAASGHSRRSMYTMPTLGLR